MSIETIDGGPCPECAAPIHDHKGNGPCKPELAAMMAERDEDRIALRNEKQYALDCLHAAEGEIERLRALLERVDHAFDAWADAGYMTDPRRKLWNEVRAAYQQKGDAAK